MADASSIPDIQGRADHRNISIDKVGVKGLRHPILVADGSGEPRPSVATVNMYVDLPHDQKGTHMSRFVAILNEHGQALDLASFRSLLDEVVRRLDARRAFVEVSFPYFVNKSAPVTGVRSLLDYEVTLAGEVAEGQADLSLQVLVPVKTLCPCSKSISEYGAHNQRSHITARVRPVAVDGMDPLWLDELIKTIEAQASSEIYGLLKRADEKFVTEKAYDNPKFVEDLARDLAGAFDAEPRIGAYRLEVENFESIHNHSAYALIERER